MTTVRKEERKTRSRGPGGEPKTWEELITQKKVRAET